MAIVSAPGWIGSSAANETGERWMSKAGGKVRLPTPFWMSQMAGRGKFNSVLYPVTTRSRDVGYMQLNNGDRLGNLENNSGVSIDQLIAVKDDRWQGGLREGVCIGSYNTGLSGFRIVFEGFNNNEVITLPNSWNDVAGTRLYYANWRIDVFWWLKSKPNLGAINMLIEPY